MSSSSSNASDNHNTHSELIPITLFQSYHTQSHSVSETSDDSVPPLSPSEFPVSATSVNIQTPLSSSSWIPLSPVSPSSPILSYFYGFATKSPFSCIYFSNTMDEGWYEHLAKHSHLISILQMKSLDVGRCVFSTFLIDIYDNCPTPSTLCYYILIITLKIC